MGLGNMHVVPNEHETKKQRFHELHRDHGNVEQASELHLAFLEDVLSTKHNQRDRAMLASRNIRNFRNRMHKTYGKAWLRKLIDAVRKSNNPEIAVVGELLHIHTYLKAESLVWEETKRSGSIVGSVGKDMAMMIVTGVIDVDMLYNFIVNYDYSRIQSNSFERKVIDVVDNIRRSLYKEFTNNVQEAMFRVNDRKSKTPTANTRFCVTINEIPDEAVSTARGMETFVSGVLLNDDFTNKNDANNITENMQELMAAHSSFQDDSSFQRCLNVIRMCDKVLAESNGAVLFSLITTTGDATLKSASTATRQRLAKFIRILQRKGNSESGNPLEEYNLMPTLCKVQGESSKDDESYILKKKVQLKLLKTRKHSNLVMSMGFALSTIMLHFPNDGRKDTAMRYTELRNN